MPSRCAWLRKSQTRCSWLWRISGPTSRSASAGPTRSAAIASAEPLEQCLVDGRSTRSRLPAEQVWPPFCTMALTTTGSDLVEVRVVEHDLRRLAAEFERDRAVMSRRGLRDRGAGDRRAGERDVIDARVRGQRRAGLGAVAGDDVERALRETRLRGEFGHAQQRQAGILGRLDDAGVAGRERGAHAAPEDLHRIVPGNDVPGDAVRLADRQHRHAGLVRDRLAVQLVGRAGVVLEVAGERGGVGARPASAACRCCAIRAAPVPRDARRPPVASFISRRPRSVGAHPAPWRRRTRRPARARAAATARSMSAAVPRAIFANGCAVGRVDHVDRLPGRRCDPSIVDEVMRPAGSPSSRHPCLSPRALTRVRLFSKRAGSGERCIAAL